MSCQYFLHELPLSKLIPGHKEHKYIYIVTHCFAFDVILSSIVNVTVSCYFLYIYIYICTDPFVFDIVTHCFAFEVILSSIVNVTVSCYFLYIYIFVQILLSLMTFLFKIYCMYILRFAGC